MKFLCPHCERLVELRDFRVEGGGLLILCPACQTSSRVAAPSTPSIALVPLPPATTGERPALQLTSFPGLSNVVALRTPGADAVQAAAEAARSSPFTVPAGHCPKCIAPRAAQASSCPSCGLTFAQFDPSQVEPVPWLSTAWVELLGRWDDEARHAELRQRALHEQQLPSLGRLYRLRLAAQSEDPIALRGRDEVLRLALITTEPTPPLARLRPLVKYVLAGLFLIACVLVLVLIARQMLAPPE